MMGVSVWDCTRDIQNNGCSQIDSPMHQHVVSVTQAQALDVVGKGRTNKLQWLLLYACQFLFVDVQVFLHNYNRSAQTKWWIAMKVAK